ncbi:MAG: type II toxin-antitoxin system VapC family toxin [Sporichthyaceae bacterium]|nr:type II toxin-antitoxin system VapC family toxin [Sporichthyaceae bacterium]
MPVVDASIVVDWVAPGVDSRGPASRLLSRLAQEAAPILAPRLLLEETANALVTGIRRGRWTGAQADTALVLLCQLPVQLVDQPGDLDRAFELSRRYDEHPVYDLIYVAVAERLGEQLVTADNALRGRLAALPFVVGPA